METGRYCASLLVKAFDDDAVEGGEIGVKDDSLPAMLRIAMQAGLSAKADNGVMGLDADIPDAILDAGVFWGDRWAELNTMPEMNSIYTTTITREARRRRIGIEVIDPVTPIFVLKYKGRKIRCYNALTDQVGAVSFHMTQNKRLANVFLKAHGFPVPAQAPFTDRAEALRFLRRHQNIVVKPCTQWGGRGVSVAVKTPDELDRAIRFARRYEEDVILEQYVAGVDYRLIFVNYKFVAAIRRRCAHVTGNGRDTIRTLIQARNRQERPRDPSHIIPLDAETGRNLKALGLEWETVPATGKDVRVRLTSNYHTGGDVDVVTSSVSRSLVATARRAAKKLAVPVIGIDFLLDEKTGRFWLIELSPDLAISPPEGEEVARHFMDYLFPETRTAARGGR